MNDSSSQSFASLFSYFRSRSTLMSLERVSDAMAELGQTLDTSTFSHWQRGTRIPRNRLTIIRLIKVLWHYQGIRYIHEANQLLAASKLTKLKKDEEEYIIAKMTAAPPKSLTADDLTPIDLPADLLRDKPRKTEALDISFNLILPSDIYTYVHRQARKSGISKATFVRHLIEEAMEN